MANWFPRSERARDTTLESLRTLGLPAPPQLLVGSSVSITGIKCMTSRGTACHLVPNMVVLQRDHPQRRMISEKKSFPGNTLQKERRELERPHKGFCSDPLEPTRDLFHDHAYFLHNVRYGA